MPCYYNSPRFVTKLAEIHLFARLCLRLSHIQSIGLKMSDCQIFIGGLDSQSASVEELEALLYELLLQCGDVVDLRVPKSDTGGSRGFAFAEMSLPKAATYAMLALNGMRLHGKPLRIACAMDEEASRQVKLENLPYDMNEIDLYFALSERVSLIRGVTVFRNKRDGRSEGKATMWMDSAEAAENAASILTSSPLHFNSIPVRIGGT